MTEKVTFEISTPAEQARNDTEGSEDSPSLRGAERRGNLDAENVILREEFTYKPGANGGTTSQVDTYTVETESSVTTYTYTYDVKGNILSISDGMYTTTYAYDAANQLIREDNPYNNTTYSWTYDSAGNILSRNEYAYTTGSLSSASAQSVIAYTYGDDAWGDLLTGYNGQAITSDTIGNTLSDGEWTYTWEHGRQLATMTKGSTTWAYTYNADGLRTQRTNGTTTYNYIYNGSQLTHMTVGNNVLHFSYDASGVPMMVTYNNTTYYYTVNLQGDITGIRAADGTELVSYSYNAWGVPTNAEVCAGSLYPESYDLLELNPLRYRGYVYDSETGLYYLQSRYYNAEVGRFICSDVFTSTGQGILGSNMFAYCGNNPVNRVDVTGCFWDLIWDIGSFIVSAVEVICNPTDVGAWVGLALDAVDVLVPCFGGLGEAADVYRAADNVADVADNIHDAGKASESLGDIGKMATSGSSNDIGKMGERLAGINSSTKTSISINGRNRIPDALDDFTLTEVKNVKYISNTKQLRDFADYANANGLSLVLYVRPTTIIAQTVRDAGWEIRFLWE